MRLLLIIGPPAVGKMTVGRRIAERTGFRLMHNHHSIEPLIEIFGHGSRAFDVLNSEFRHRVIEEAARSRLDLVFSFVWNLDDPADLAEVESLVRPYTGEDAQILVVELRASLPTRLQRNHGADRLAAKPSKQDLAWSSEDVRRHDAHRLNTEPGIRTAADAFLAAHPHLRLVTDQQSAEQTVSVVLDWLDAVPGD